MPEPELTREATLARFTVLTTAGCAIWASGFVVAGMLLGASWQDASHALRLSLLPAGGAAAAAILLSARHFKARSRAHR